MKVLNFLFLIFLGILGGLLALYVYNLPSYKYINKIESMSDFSYEENIPLPKVEFLPVEEILQKYYTESVPEHPVEILGLYNIETNTISINNTESREVQDYTLFHEYIHFLQNENGGMKMSNV